MVQFENFTLVSVDDKNINSLFHILVLDHFPVSPIPTGKVELNTIFLFVDQNSRLFFFNY